MVGLGVDSFLFHIDTHSLTHAFSHIITED